MSHRATVFCLHALLLSLSLLIAACSSDETPFASSELAARGAFTAALSNDGTRALIGSLTHGGSLWNLDTGERLFNWNHQAHTPSSIIAAGFSPEARFAMTAENDQLVLWNTQTGEALTFFRAPSQVLCLALGPEGRYALLGLADGTAVVFDAMKGGVERVFVHAGPVRSVSLNAAATLAITGSDDRSARLWELASGKQLQRWEHRSGVRLVALSPGGERAFSASKYDYANVWDTQTGLKLGKLATFASRLSRGETYTAAAFSADGTQLLTGNSSRGTQLWQLPGPSQRGAWNLPRRSDWKRSGAYVLSVGFNLDKDIYMSISADGFVHRLRLASR